MRALLALLAALAACAPPTQSDPARFGLVRVAFAPDDWPSDDRDAFRAELRALSALGPAFVEALGALAADVTIAHWESPDCARDGAARYVLGTAVVQLDPVCAQGFTQLRAEAGHELMHWLLYTRWRFTGHICRAPTSASTRPSPTAGRRPTPRPPTSRSCARWRGDDHDDPAPRDVRARSRMSHEALTVMITLVSLIAGAALAWGVMQTTVRQLREIVRELQIEVRDLRREISSLGASVQVLRALDAREQTGRHAARDAETD